MTPPVPTQSCSRPPGRACGACCALLFVGCCPPQSAPCRCCSAACCAPHSLGNPVSPDCFLPLPPCLFSLLPLQRLVRLVQRHAGRLGARCLPLARARRRNRPGAQPKGSHLWAGRRAARLAPLRSAWRGLGRDCCAGLCRARCERGLWLCRGQNPEGLGDLQLPRGTTIRYRPALPALPPAPDDERHLDLRCWMALASRALATIGANLGLPQKGVCVRWGGGGACVAPGLHDTCRQPPW